MLKRILKMIFSFIGFKKNIEKTEQNEKKEEKKLDVKKRVFGTRSLENLATVDRRLQLFASELLQLAKYDFTITQGNRTAEEQNKLYQLGRTKKGKIVTYCDGYKKLSRHQGGRAIDIAILQNGKISWNEKLYQELVDEKVRDLMKKYKVKWGGDFKKFKDFPHFELMEG